MIRVWLLHRKIHIFSLCDAIYLFIFILALNGGYLTALIVNGSMSECVRAMCVLVTQTYCIYFYFADAHGSHEPRDTT